MLKSCLLFLVTGNSFGSFDEFLSCDRMFDSTPRRARVLDIIPETCDMTKNGYCFERGNYPEHTIQQFLQENLGLMKRMNSEMNSMDIKREMRSTGFNKYAADQRHDEAQERQFKASSFNLIPDTENLFNGLRYDINGQLYNVKRGSGLAMVQNAKDETVSHRSRTKTEPMFKVRAEDEDSVPIEKETSSIKITTNVVSSSSSSVSVSTTVTSSSTNADVTWGSTLQPTTVQPNAVVQESTLATSLKNDEHPSTDFATTITDGTVMPDDFIIEATTQEAPEYSEYEYENTAEGDLYDSSGDYEDETLEGDYTEQKEEIETVEEQSVEIEPEQLETILPEMLQTTDIEEIEEEEIEEIDEGLENPIYEYTGESINACEVHETIEAPYWANNTRNQILALLNLYPFEQYIHMETCKAEHEEMLCRPGCRCEQQYRLHRLLAFDPNNECRGIFSDWFRFPSFCLCKCYSQASQIKEVKMKKSLSLRAKKDMSLEGKSHNGPGPTHNVKDGESSNEIKSPHIINHQMEGIPAVFPYEGRASLFAEMLNFNPNGVDEKTRAAKLFEASPRGMGTPQNTEIVREDPQDIILNAIADEHMDNMVESDQVHEKKNHKESRQLDDHFFYNQPIIEFNLPDGSMGTVQQTPRK